MRLTFVLSQVGQGLRRNLAMTVAVIIVTCVSLLFVGSAVLAEMQINNLRDTWYGKIEISVSMCTKDDVSPNCNGQEATEAQIAAIDEQLKSERLSKYIDNVYFETKEEAFESFKKLAGTEQYYQYVSADMMPASFRIKLKNPEQYRVVVEELQGRDGVAQVIDQKQILEKLLTGLHQATYLAIGLAVAMIIAAVLLITTTIRLSAMSRERETSIMRLVGASNLFVQLPFMVEGAIAATIGALGSVAILWASVKFLVGSWLSGLSGVVELISTNDVLLIAPFLVLAAILLAIVASAASLNRYTRV